MENNDLARKVIVLRTSFCNFILRPFLRIERGKKSIISILDLLLSLHIISPDVFLDCSSALKAYYTCNEMKRMNKFDIVTIIEVDK